MTTDFSAFHRAAEAATSHSPALGWLQAVRDAALERFTAHGFPTTAEEDWRYTDLAPAVRRLSALAGQPAGPSLPELQEPLRERLAPIGTSAMLLDGGVLQAPASPGGRAGLSISTLGQANGSDREALASRIGAATDQADAALPALNAALLRDGLAIEVAPGAIIEELIYIAAGTRAGSSAHNRILLRLAPGAQATVIEHHISLGGGVSNSVTDIVCESGSRLAYVKLQAEADDAIHLATQRLRLEREAHVELLHLDLGALLARNDLRVELVGPGADVSAHGLFFADESRHLDNHTRIDHRAPHTRSRELYRGIADARGRGVFNGKVIVHTGAGGTDARLSNQNLLLSPFAEIDTKPELEIYADDVKCSHGATTGALDRAAIFYLRSRGIPAADARRMLIAAFAREIVARLPAGALERHILALLRKRLPDIGEVEPPS